MPIAKQTVATVIPALQYQDAPAAIDFLCRAFGFTKNAVYEGEGGSIAHAQLTLGNGMVMLGSAKETDYGELLVRPRAAGGVTMSVYVIVEDADAHFARAKSAGAEITSEGLRRPRLHLQGSRRPCVDLRHLRSVGQVLMGQVLMGQVLMGQLLRRQPGCRHFALMAAKASGPRRNWMNCVAGAFSAVTPMPAAKPTVRWNSAG
jgi:uncharacterized glyoxalase superfamily protein PhnB